MMRKRNMTLLSFSFVMLLMFAGCTSMNGNTGQVGGKYYVADMEAEWIRNAEPIKFEGELWKPQDMVDVLTDSEVYVVGEQGGVKFFVQKLDVRPYRRLYTKFGRNKFRIFERVKPDDKSK